MSDIELTPEQLERIDQISKQMLEKIGTDVFSEKAKSIYKKNAKQYFF